MNNIAPQQNEPPSQNWRLLDQGIRATLRIDIRISQGSETKRGKTWPDGKLQAKLLAYFVVPHKLAGEVLVNSATLLHGLSRHEAVMALESFSEVLLLSFPQLGEVISPDETLSLICSLMKQAPAGIIPDWAQPKGAM